jgi:hypothetical protein
MNTTARRLAATLAASGLLLGAAPVVGQADAAPLKGKVTQADKKVKFSGTLRKN